MARPVKIGLDYFPLDTNIDGDDKIQLIEAEFGSKGFAIIIKLFCKIYADKGYYYNWTEVEKLLFAKRMGETVGLVDEIVKRSVKWGLFEESVFNQFQVLTSSAIQSRFLEAVSRRENIEMFKEFLLIDISDYKNRVNVNINSINVDKSTQSKVKESKLKENIVVAPTLKSFKQFSKTDFTNEIQPFLQEFGKELCNHFFSYWTEKSASGKMKFQLEKTWDTKHRLDTWQRNENRFGSKQQKEVPTNRVKEKEL